MKIFLDVKETTLTYVDVLENWEIAPGDLVLLDTKLGEGQFGIVRQGLLSTGKGDSEVVAVKTLKGIELLFVKRYRTLIMKIRILTCIQESGKKGYASG